MIKQPKPGHYRLQTLACRQQVSGDAGVSLWQWLQAERENGHLYTAEQRTHRDELFRTEYSRRFSSQARINKERDILIKKALRESHPSNSLFAEGEGQVFPWQNQFADHHHCLGKLAIQFAEIPEGEEQLQPWHQLTSRSLANRFPRIICYPASWGVQTGQHPNGQYQNKPIDYFQFAPTYLRICSKNLRAILPYSNLPPVISAVFPALNEAERKLTEYAFAEDNTFCHPYLQESTRQLYLPMLLDQQQQPRSEADIIQRFSGTLLYGFSYGACIIFQQIAYLKKLMVQHGFLSSFIDYACSHLLLILIAPNVDIDLQPSCPKLVARSPLDAIVSGHPQLGYLSCVQRDQSATGFSTDTLSKLAKGQFEQIQYNHNAILIGDHCLQFNYALPGIVQYDHNGQALDPFLAGKCGHDVKPYIDLLRDNTLFKNCCSTWLEGRFFIHSER